VGRGRRVGSGPAQGPVQARFPATRGGPAVYGIVVFIMRIRSAVAAEGFA